MQNWQEEYKRKLISAEEAAAKVKSGDNVAFTAGREALTVGMAIAARLGELKGVKVAVPSPGYDFGWYDEGWNEAFEITISWPTATVQDMLDQRRCDVNLPLIIPFSTEGEPPDVLLTEVTPPDERGFCSFGASLWSKRQQIKHAKLTIAEVNDRLIRTHGDNYVHVSEIDYFVIHESRSGQPGTGSLGGRVVKDLPAYQKDIVKNVASLIKDGDTIQIGVGRTTEPLVKMGLFNGRNAIGIHSEATPPGIISLVRSGVINGKRKTLLPERVVVTSIGGGSKEEMEWCNDIGIHSEATPPGIISLVRSGVINGKRKTLLPERVVVTSIGGGSKEEMEWCNDNPMFYLVDLLWLEDIRVIAQNDNMVAINNALAVDMTGQITAESIGPKLMSVAGGQIPFAFGALLSKGGRSITVLPSTAQDGKVSRIMAHLPEGTAITLQRNIADLIVTEYGVANMRHKTLRQRCEQLINVAHPNFREELWKEARKLYWP